MIRPPRRTYVIVVREADELLCGGYKWVSRFKAQWHPFVPATQKLTVSDLGFSLRRYEDDVPVSLSALFDFKASFNQLHLWQTP